MAPSQRGAPPPGLIRGRLLPLGGPWLAGGIPLRYARDLRPLAAVPLAAARTSLHRPPRRPPPHRCGSPEIVAAAMDAQPGEAGPYALMTGCIAGEAAAGGGEVRPASRGPLPQRPCTERVDAPLPARRPTEAYPLRYGEGWQRSRSGCSGPRMPGSEGMDSWRPERSREGVLHGEPRTEPPSEAAEPFGRTMTGAPCAEYAGTFGHPSPPLETRVGCVLDPLAQEVVPEEGDQDGQTGIDGEPPRDLDVVLTRREDVPPGRGGRLHADSKEREA